MSYYWIEKQIHRLDRLHCVVVITGHCWQRTQRRAIRDADVMLQHGKEKETKD